MICPICIRYSVKKMFLKTTRNSQKNACARVSFYRSYGPEACQVLFCESCKILKNTKFYKAILVAASVHFSTTDSYVMPYFL